LRQVRGESRPVPAVSFISTAKSRKSTVPLRRARNYPENIPAIHHWASRDPMPYWQA
jgi:hypothetical protein